jgi:hypothetical protein
MLCSINANIERETLDQGGDFLLPIVGSSLASPALGSGRGIFAPDLMAPARRISS